MQKTQETLVLSLDREDPLEEEMATHSSILAWKNPMDRGAYSPWGRKELDTTEATSCAHMRGRWSTLIYLCFLQTHHKNEKKKVYQLKH